MRWISLGGISGRARSDTTAPARARTSATSCTRSDISPDVGTESSLAKSQRVSLAKCAPSVAEALVSSPTTETGQDPRRRLAPAPNLLHFAPLARRHLDPAQIRRLEGCGQALERFHRWACVHTHHRSETGFGSTRRYQSQIPSQSNPPPAQRPIRQKIRPATFPYPRDCWLFRKCRCSSASLRVSAGRLFSP